MELDLVRSDNLDGLDSLITNQLDSDPVAMVLFEQKPEFRFAFCRARVLHHFPNFRFSFVHMIRSLDCNIGSRPDIKPLQMLPSLRAECACVMTLAAQAAETVGHRLWPNSAGSVHELPEGHNAEPMHGIYLG